MIGPLTRIGPDVVVSRFQPETSPAASQETPATLLIEPPSQHPAQGKRLIPAEPDTAGPSGNGQRPHTEPKASGDVSRLLSLLADRTRLKILRIVAGGERPVVSLTSELKLPQPTVSHHLAWLRMMDLVSPRRQGKHIYYGLGPAAAIDDAGNMTFKAFDAAVTVSPKRKE